MENKNKEIIDLEDAIDLIVNHLLDDKDFIDEFSTMMGLYDEDIEEALRDIVEDELLLFEEEIFDAVVSYRNGNITSIIFED